MDERGNSEEKEHEEKKDGRLGKGEDRVARGEEEGQEEERGIS